MSRAERAGSSWGERRTVAIALDDLEPGHVITADDVEFSQRPLAVIPEDPVGSPVGMTVIRPIVRNEVVIGARLSGGTANGPTAMLDERTIAFAVPRDESTPAVRIGDRVALFAPPEVVASAGRTTGPALRISDHATVIHVSDSSIMVGVDAADAPEVARSLLSGAVIVGLTE